MRSSLDFPQHPSSHKHSSVGLLTSGLRVHGHQNKSRDTYIRYALQALSERDQILPEHDRVTLIVEAALAAQALLFAASMHDPDPIELHRFFELFVLNCVIPPEKRSTP